MIPIRLPSRRAASIIDSSASAAGAHNRCPVVPTRPRACLGDVAVAVRRQAHRNAVGGHRGGRRGRCPGHRRNGVVERGRKAAPESADGMSGETGGVLNEAMRVRISAIRAVTPSLPCNDEILPRRRPDAARFRCAGPRLSRAAESVQPHRATGPR